VSNTPLKKKNRCFLQTSVGASEEKKRGDLNGKEFTD